MKKLMFGILTLFASLPVLAEEEGIEKGLEVWSLMGFFEVSLILLMLGLVLHIASLYYSRVMTGYKIRLSGENFGIVFVLIRDLSLFGAFGIGALLINPDIFADIKLALPFIPLGTLILGIALIVKLSKDVDKDWKSRKLFLTLLSTAAAIQYLGFIFVMEAAPADWVKSGHASGFWLYLRGLRSNLNPELSMWTFYICFPLLLIIFIKMVMVGFSKRNWEIKENLEIKK